VVAEGGWSHRLVRAPVADCGTGELMFWLGRVVIGVRRAVSDGAGAIGWCGRWWRMADLGRGSDWGPAGGVGWRLEPSFGAGSGGGWRTSAGAVIGAGGWWRMAARIVGWCGRWGTSGCC